VLPVVEAEWRYRFESTLQCTGVAGLLRGQRADHERDRHREGVEPSGSLRKAAADGRARRACNRNPSDVAVSHARLASGWRAAPLYVPA